MTRIQRWHRVVLGVALLGGLAAQASAETQTFQGEVVDPSAYLKDGSRGATVTDRTYEAVDGGQSLAILDATNALYLALAERAGEDPNELLYDYANQQVQVTGTVYERDGVKGIVVTAVEPLEKPDTKPPSSATTPETATPPAPSSDSQAATPP